MSKKTPGKSHRTGISMRELFRRFPDDASAEAWFIERRWPTGIACPHCGSQNVQTGAKHKTMPYRCREKQCAKRFSAKTGTVMEGSKLGFQVWMIATYLLSTSLKSVSSMKLHRDLNINQRSAWFLAHRLRVALSEEGIENHTLRTLARIILPRAERAIPQLRAPPGLSWKLYMDQCP